MILARFLFLEGRERRAESGACAPEGAGRRVEARLTGVGSCGKMVADETVASETIFLTEEIMATIMRKMNVISRCEAMYRTQQSSNQLAGIYHSYVFAICANSGLSQDKLAKHLCINKSSVTRHLACLEKDGYVERRVSETDKRETLVYPTQKMLDILPEVSRITSEWNSLMAEGISKEELEVFHNIMDKMLEKSLRIIYSGESAE